MHDASYLVSTVQAILGMLSVFVIDVAMQYQRLFNLLDHLNAVTFQTCAEMDLTKCLGHCDDDDDGDDDDR
jgi:hypothetical protein